MEREVTPGEARDALETIERGRLRVIDEIDLPSWYFRGLALGWIGLGLVTDLGNPWVTAAATLGFGAAHSTVAPHVLSGRHGSQRLSVSAAVAGRQVPRLVIGSLIILAALTTVGSIVAAADGARHPVTAASIVVAVMIVLGGPRLLVVIRRGAARAVTPP